MYYHCHFYVFVVDIVVIIKIRIVYITFVGVVVVVCIIKNVVGIIVLPVVLIMIMDFVRKTGEDIALVLTNRIVLSFTVRDTKVVRTARFPNIVEPSPLSPLPTSLPIIAVLHVHQAACAQPRSMVQYLYAKLRMTGVYTTFTIITYVMYIICTSTLDNADMRIGR